MNTTYMPNCANCIVDQPYKHRASTSFYSLGILHTIKTILSYCSSSKYLSVSN